MLELANIVLPTVRQSELITSTPLRPNFSKSSEADELPTNPPAVNAEVTTPNTAFVIVTHEDEGDKEPAEGP